MFLLLSLGQPGHLTGPVPHGCRELGLALQKTTEEIKKKSFLLGHLHEQHHCSKCTATAFAEGSSFPRASLAKTLTNNLFVAVRSTKGHRSVCKYSSAQDSEDTKSINLPIYSDTHADASLDMLKQIPGRMD